LRGRGRTVTAANQRECCAQREPRARAKPAHPRGNVAEAGETGQETTELA
jgi:hypothetical protein